MKISFAKKEKISNIHLSDLFAEEDYDQFCLAYMFTYRDFEMGTLGLAWTGDLKNAGGVCEKNGVSVWPLSHPWEEKKNRFYVHEIVE